MRQFTLTVARNSAVGTAAQLAIKLLSFGFSVLVVRQLGAESYGQYAAVAAFGTMFLFIGDLGLSPYLVREVARARNDPDGAARIDRLFGNVLVLRLLLSAIGCALMLLVAWLSGRPWIMIGAMALNAAGMILYGAQGAFEALLGGFERLDISAVAKVVYQLTFVTFGAAALYWGWGYYGLIYATLLAVVVLTYVCGRNALRLGVRPQRVDVRAWLGLLRASLPFGVIGFTLGLSYKFDSVLLNVFRSDAETGYYNAAYSLVFSTVMLSNLINTSLYPSLTRQAASEPQQLPQIYERALRYLLLLALPIAVGAWALADKIVPFLFGAGYLPAIPALQIVIWVVPLMFLSEFLGYVVLVAGRERSVARSVLISTGANVTLNLLLVPRYGLVAAAAMTVITEAVLVCQYLWLLRAQLRVIAWRDALLRPVLAALLMGCLVLWLPGLSLLASVALGALCYSVLLVVVGALGRDELRFIRSLRAPAELPPASEGPTP
jgi:O-antigen/teichoic acid export membrane protein